MNKKSVIQEANYIGKEQERKEADRKLKEMETAKERDRVEKESKVKELLCQKGKDDLAQPVESQGNVVPAPKQESASLTSTSSADDKKNDSSLESRSKLSLSPLSTFPSPTQER